MIALGLAQWPAEEKGLPYRLKRELLSAAELDFYRALRPVVGQWAVICQGGSGRSLLSTDR